MLLPLGEGEDKLSDVVDEVGDDGDEFDSLE